MVEATTTMIQPSRHFAFWFTLSIIEVMLGRSATLHCVTILALVSTLWQHRVEGKGVCYDSFDYANMDAHFTTIKSRFDAVRTYQTQNTLLGLLWPNGTNTTVHVPDGPNSIDVAARHNLLIYAGVWIRSPFFEADLQAAIDGASRHPASVKAILIGNEDLSNGLSLQTMVDTINEAKARIRATPGLEHIPVGTVQTDGDWIKYPSLAAVCDVVGVNMYAFFDPYDFSTINNVIPHMNHRWQAMVSRFGKKALLTETGWPTDGGGPFRNHQASIESAIKHFWDVQDWMDTNGGEHPMYFMFHDNPAKSTDIATLFENYFGLAYPSGAWKFDVYNRPVPDPRWSLPFKIATSRDHVLRCDGGGLFKGPSDNANDRWSYDVNTHQVKCWQQGTCLDGFWDSANRFTVHMYACNAANNNQKWIFSDLRLKHEIYTNRCLDADRSDIHVQVWPCQANNNHQLFTIAGDMGHVSLVSVDRKRTLVAAAGTDRDGGERIAFAHGWFPSQGWVPADGQWTFLHDKNMVMSESRRKCLDAPHNANGSPIHLWPCNDSNGNQKWAYDATTKQLRHTTHKGFCLDMGSNNGYRPHLWECHAPNDAYAKFQQFNYAV
ncbi:hypothetical protein DYB37_007142 [Aphanomyces astaci]|uniref:glucan endo-1,3-beta-D-glucosidase n=2 Tax=Aphanomyces astaci TaxID=112090 RepID=A0A418DBP5_APHAT|nr:hypothetical protein DYB35_005446 [Aphanomyces astaci]RHZ27090.1 hypothetical protein DYB37_007142 [Aphanomyces astaci]